MQESRGHRTTRAFKNAQHHALRLAVTPNDFPIQRTVVM